MLVGYYIMSKISEENFLSGFCQFTTIEHLTLISRVTKEGESSWKKKMLMISLFRQNSLYLGSGFSGLLSE